ncbi:XendoU domain-containing protein [Cephalotus follicularis]|uniref:XendoU domain-containing protein n=1 Tax=Cephalotus follicularis TaxID=3775 RepID=A0A1Q3CBF2_CEPFO|nr:XendoU domain-containing protein [Cephalotus follicularis]
MPLPAISINKQKSLLLARSLSEEEEMEGLIKGLIDVALGGHHDDREREEESGPPQSRVEQQSRSTWAEVVTAHQGNDDDDDRDRTNRSNQNKSYRKAAPVLHEGYAEEANQNRWNRKEDRQENNDMWETVEGKPPRRSHKVLKDQWHGYKQHPSEQEYSDDVEIGGSLEPSEEELSDLSQACNKLWELDLNRLVPGKDYQIDCGEGKKVYQKEDMAEGSLFYWLSEGIFRRPTFSRFCSLLDNYNPNSGYKEEVTSEERQEQAAFIEEISRTAPIKYLHKYLSSKGIVSESYQDFKKIMTGLWFDLYGRGGTSGSSSAFEHVFVGEIKQRGEREVCGFHNWLQFYLEEAKGNVDYQGYIFPRRRGQTPDSETQLLTVQFEWNGVLKSVSSILVGVSPEFEIALYTLCFYMGGEDNYVQLGPYSINIKCYHFQNKIGSVFPIAE